MAKPCLYVIGLIVFSMLLGVSEANAASSSYPGLILVIKSNNDQGKGADFAVNEPVWLSIAISNTNVAPVLLWIYCDKDWGMECQPVQSDEQKITIMQRIMPGERISRKLALKAGQSETLGDVLLGDFLQASEMGTFPIQFSLEMRDDKGKRWVIKTVVPLQFTRRLSTREIRKLVNQWQQQYNSGDERTRARIIRSTVSVPAPVVIDFLAKAMFDNSEDVQLSVLDVLSRINLPKEQVMPLIQKAAQSDKDSVRQNALWVIERLQGTAPGAKPRL